MEFGMGDEKEKNEGKTVKFFFTVTKKILNNISLCRLLFLRIAILKIGRNRYGVCQESHKFLSDNFQNIHVTQSQRLISLTSLTRS